MGKIATLMELWDFLRVRKKFWLFPIILVLILLSMFVIFVESSALAPFIYAIF